LERVTVPLPGRSYDVTIAAGALDEAASLIPGLATGTARAFIVVDRAITDTWLPALELSLDAREVSHVALSVPSGEAAKSMQVFDTLLHQLASQEAHRDDLILALGGGTVGDLAGFVASTYMRGLPFVQVPTTLIGQVDAAIGGKTAVNLPEGKNLVGSFYQPLAVICDVATLATLDERDYRSGLGEVVKYALALDADLLDTLERDPAPVLARDPGALEALVARCVGIKAATVAADERDTGARMFLNYGHTLGHALERLDAFSGRTHGEAIAVGMVFAARLGESRGIAPEGLTGRTARLLTSVGLEVGGPLPSVRDILSAFRMDKKFQGGVRFVLLHDVGRPTVVEGVTDDELREILTEMGSPG
jgi:3-dehydroquinate synthase